ncbi:probable G-protein coupled receptor Mth-like 4 [Mytilus californianus]|uniref:probable G-protein coupled receptor Mth-like 4 n=1 Tax=Mytilus californianus TaxID=6549 RepID=UPI00224672F0|nr:probable G-protein coupled receptor Mth-like 4 [Mytilus californianus]
MISHCPVSSDNVTKKKCEISTSLLQKLQNIPVYSSRSGLSYRNVHCSVCHNESMGDIIPWKIEIECAEFADFNFLSTYSEIIDYAIEKKCDIFYSSSGVKGLHINTCDDNYLLDDGLISKCNVSGTWITFDASIDFACQMYDNRFHSFKNVFCHLCNPPNEIGGVISKCNTTGLWDVFSTDLEKACLNNIQSPLTTPFKNIYCFYCNSNNKNKTDNVHFNELEFSVEEKNANIEHDEYILTSPRKARICANRLQTLNTRTDSFNSVVVWNTVALILTCISLLCLVLTFLTYCFFPSLRTLPGKNNVCLVSAMFCAQFIFQFVEFGTKSDIGCKVIGVLIHYFWLVTFGCLSVCSFHMYYVFTSKTSIHISETFRLAVYILYSYGIPVIIVVLNIVITSSLSSVTSIGYGGHVCFLNRRIAFVVTFIIPISLVCCSNIFFFIVTALKIARRPKLKNDSQMNLNQIQFSVYVKLFSITGISWIFQIIDSFIPFSAFSTIVSFLNALQELESW